MLKVQRQGPVLITLLALAVIHPLYAGAQEVVPGLVLCNELGSLSEVQNSAVGPDFTIHSDGLGGVLFVPGVFGGALATTGGETGRGGYLMMAPSDFFPENRERGAVELWLQKRKQRFIPFQDPLVGIFGFQPYDYNDPIRSYDTISVFWSDGYSGLGGMDFTLYDSETYHRCNDPGWDDVPVGKWVHVAFVWDIVGIEGTDDRMRIVRDGEARCSNTDLIPGIRSDERVVKILGHHAYSRFGQPTVYMDNLKVWDFAKTDFADRFEEGCATNQPPVATAGPDEAVECTDGERTPVALDGSGSDDPDGDPLTFEWFFEDGGRVIGEQPTPLLPLGVHAITLIVEDSHGATDDDEVVKTVADSTPPEIQSLAADPGILRPPNHRMRSVTVAVASADVCDSASPVCWITTVSSNEPENGTGDGDTAPDWEITGDLTVDLRAERAGGGDGRVYTLEVACADVSGNVASAGVEVTVPHDQP